MNLFIEAQLLLFRVNIIHLLLLSQFGLIKGGNVLTALSPHHHTRSHTKCNGPPLNYVNMKITDESKVLVHVNLKQTKRVLANENLPIWILNGEVGFDSLEKEDGHELQRNYEVMKQLGDFTIYQEPETSSSAIYFHKRREFDGMIDCEYFIKNLPVSRFRRNKETSIPLNRFGVYRRPEYEGHGPIDAIEDPASGVNYQELMKTYEGRVYDGYPEVLVIVSWDLTEHWIEMVPEVDWYSSVVSNVLTLFNGIDMLYSKLQKTKIQINIAGVIIEMKPKSLRFLNKCYYPENGKNESPELKLIGGCINSLFRRYLGARKTKIPIDSYDIAIFLTEEKIFHVLDNGAPNEEKTVIPVLGISSCMLAIYENRIYDEETILVGTIRNLENMESYATIAHEMAHLMTVRHDKIPYFTKGGECCAGVMKTEGDWCNRCMSWSETSEESFELFFSSPNCCAFINKPQSLNPPGRQQMLTADDQCQCYGFESAEEDSEIPLFFCSTALRCNAANDSDGWYTYIATAIPMDGTPCGDNEVCYHRLCQEVEVSTIST